LEEYEEREYRRIIRREILMAIIGGLLAISAFFMIVVSDTFVRDKTIYMERGIITNTTKQLPVNSTIIFFIYNDTTYKTKLSINSSNAVITLNWRGHTRVYHLTSNNVKEIIMPGITIFNITYFNGNKITYCYSIVRTIKPYNFLSIPAFILAMTGNVIVLISLYRIIILRRFSKK
jgi:hypothetical protein